ncbi:hypothetical protein [Roseivirga sp.]|uniref:hypothetical protein n=1 Tax=Roseivirga sp. TaxID=1964215 RepID=UPI003B8CAC47
MNRLILIAGVSRSGKSSLAERLASELPASIVIHQDNYILPLDKLPKIKDRIDWEKRETIDWFRLKNDLHGHKKSYQYILLEGIFALSDKEILKQSAMKIALSITKNEFIKRRKMEQRWGDEPDWFYDHVWESHLINHNPHGAILDETFCNISELQYSELKEKIRLL